MPPSSPFTLPDWTVVASLVLALFSIGFGAFSIYQASTAAKRAEDLNTQTQVALKEISDYARNIEATVKEMQSQQMGLIAKTQERLVEVVASSSTANINASIEKQIDKKLSGMHEEHYY